VNKLPKSDQLLEKSYQKVTNFLKIDKINEKSEFHNTKKIYIKLLEE
jgi:hypothetical protein